MINLFNPVSRRTVRFQGVPSVFGSFAGLAFLVAVLFPAAQVRSTTYAGHVADANGTPLGGVRVNYSWVGSPGFVTTDGNGNWSSSGWVYPEQATWSVEPQSGYSFNPPSRSYQTPVGGTVSGVNFSRSTRISGTVTRNGAGLAGVIITLSGPTPVVTTTDANGNYTSSGLGSGTYTITPSRQGTIFSPASLTVTVGPAAGSQNFTVQIPAVFTGQATNVAFGEAILTGVIEAGATNQSSVWFEYGTGGLFGSRTPVQIVVSATGQTPVSAAITQLSAGTVYNFRLVAANAFGTNQGNAQIFVMPYPAAATAVSFDGVSGSASVSKVNGLGSGNTPHTIEAWVKPDALPPVRAGVMVLGNVVPGGHHWLLLPSGQVQMGPVGGDASQLKPVIPVGAWTHLAAVSDGTHYSVFTNGVLFGTTTNISGLFNLQGIPMTLGLPILAGENYFAGAIDELRIWSVARSAAEVQNNFKRHLTGTEPGLVAYFPFNEGSGTTAADIGPNSLTAILQSGAYFTNSGAPVSDPVVTTRPAVPVLATRATLQSVVNPAQSGTVAYFEYGDTIAYGSQTPGLDIGSGLVNVPVSATITNLQPGTTYHFHAVAFNSTGTSVGEDQTFTTLVLGVGWPTSTRVTGGFATSPRHVVDAQGNAYVAGVFSGSATFNRTLQPQGGSGTNAFIGKLARGADWLWATNIPINTPGSMLINALAIDDARNVYVAGWFSGTATFGTNVLNASGQTDAFVAKLNSQGDTWLWARSAGATGFDSANTLAVTPAGKVFVAGNFQGTVNFGSNGLSSTNGSQDIFIAKLDTAGNWLWARSAGGTNQNDSASAIVLNAAEDAYVTGTFQGTNAIFGTTILSAAGGPVDTDLFVARISTDGLWLLARRAGGAGPDAGTGLAIDAAGNPYLLGQFAGTSDYSGAVSNLNATTDTRLFVAKLNPNANLLWYAQAGAGSANSIALDQSGHVYLTGDFSISTAFGSPPAISLVSSGNSDVFVAQLDADSGGWIWAKKIGSTGAETRGSVGVDGQGGVVVSGTFQSTVPVGYVLLTTPNDRDIFIARLDQDGVFEHNTYTIGQPIPVPIEAQDPGRDDGGAIGQPTITILEKQQDDSDNINSFVWSLSENKLFPVRPVTAILKWPLTTSVTNTTSVATAVGRCIFPAEPQIHVAGAPVELEPAVTNYPYRFASVAFSTVSGANVEASSKVFNAGQPGWTVLQFLNTGGELPNPTLHPSKFEVVRTILWNDPAYLADSQPAVIGSALTHPAHNDPTGKNGLVFFDKAFYDGAGDERAYDRVTRSGPILPVNKDTSAPDDDLVVIWYRTNTVTGIAWPSLPVRYIAQWPASPDELVLASGAGSGVLDPLVFPDKRVYNQPDPTLPGYNPNEEHAALYGDVLYALRNDLNAVVGASEPYTLLKYRDPANNQWALKIFKVVTTNAAFQFVYSGEAGQQLQLPAPLSLLPQCGTSNTWVSGPGFQDYLGRLYARAAGPNNSGETIVARYWYPLQPGFFYDLNRDGQPDAPVGQCVPWLDRRPGGTVGVPVNVTYNIKWPAEPPTLQIGETLFGAKFGLPDLRNFSSARLIFDEGDPGGTNGISSLARLFDPLSPRTLQLRPDGATNFISGPGYSVFRVSDASSLFTGLATANDAGLTVFTDLPFTLQSRLRYDALNNNLIFRGFLDENQSYGGPDNPLLLLNVLSPRERDRIKQLNGDPDFGRMIDALYDLTRNPGNLDLDGDGQPDKSLLVGLTTNDAGVIVTEKLSDGPKVLSAGNARANGFVTVVENDDPSLAGLPVTLHVIQIADGPVRGDIKVVQSDNAFDQMLTLRHSADFGGEPQRFDFEWYYQPVEAGTDPSIFPTVETNGTITDLRGWIQYSALPPGPTGLNDITLGDGGESSLLVLSDNYFICRYRGYVINGQTNWSDWVGIIGGGQAQLAEGWVKRVRDGLNPFEARSAAFHENETVTFASMLQQAGARYEGDIAFNPAGGNINNIGLIEAYQTVLNRAKRLSIEGSPPIDYQPANDALLLAAGFIADLYMLLGNEAYADAADPTIGFRTDGTGYGTLAPSIFAFQNQVDSLLEEELCLLRGRDDRSASVRVPPVYNRLFWNFTHDDGEVAYAQAYNITDQNHDGFINASDARIMYPQGHGDAWGHYLTATKTYYSLLQNTNFDWVPRSEPILLAGVPVDVDYLDERKFARAAAAKAKTGAEIVDLTYRLNYVDDPNGQFQGYKDTDISRAWGLSEWGHRAGSAAFFDWVIANAILPAVDPNTNHVGIDKIDRTTVLEIDEIVTGYEAVQGQVNKADVGLNPLGIAKNAVPFDIDPTQISAGKTHFEQIYERALDAVNNAVTVFNYANQLSQALRSLQDSVNNFSRTATERERDFKNRLIELFGYPYAGDIGPGKTYPPDYDGPDLYHYMYVNTIELNGDTAPLSQSFTGFFTPTLGLNISQTEGITVGIPWTQIKKTFGAADFYFPDDVPQNPGDRLGTNILQVSYPYSAADYGFTAPASWGQRRAPGEIQIALSELVQNDARFKQAQLNYDNLILQIDDQLDLLQARYDLEREKLVIRNKATAETVALTVSILAAKRAQSSLKDARELMKDSMANFIEGLPKVVGTASDVFSAVRAAAAWGRTAADHGLVVAESVAGAVEQSATAVKDTIKDSTALEIEKAGFKLEVQQQLSALEELFRQEAGLRVEAFAQREVVTQSVGHYLASVEKGLRLAEERAAFRKNAAADTQQSRYQDMTFRIFRNDAIQKYRAQFDLAAQYVFLAAVAYDFETQLLGGHGGAGREFLTDIVRQRSLGQIEGGVPVAGRHGLADPLARLSLNFGVLKGQLGFNNPQTETGRFSLRSELLRMRDSSDTAWRAELKKRIVANLWDVPEFRRYCRPFAPESAGPQPGLVIRFPTTVTFGLNYFGWPLGGGDSAYDPTLFATKVRSAGVWFSNYDGNGLSLTPRVYLVPVGADILRSPSGTDLETREWRVVDQKIPVPFPIGFSSLNDPTWIPINDSLSDTFADIRRFSSFRAYHDSGVFDPSETITDSRLIGRSVWNTDWMLIIPGGTFLFDPNQGLDVFINSVSDIKIFFQTYAYSGN